MINHSIHKHGLLFLENALREKYTTKIDEEVDSVIQKYKQQIENGEFSHVSISAADWPARSKSQFDWLLI